ncbi:MAG: RNA polymerase sigma factor [Acidimicrobiales bacterium]
MVSTIDAQVAFDEESTEYGAKSAEERAGSRSRPGQFGGFPRERDEGYADPDAYADGSDIVLGYVDMGRDRELVARCQAGDKNAFGALYSHYYRRVYFTCYKLLGNVQDAEDVAQETFARAWKALPSFGGERRFYPWLSVIASNLCIGNLRKRSHSTPVDEIESLAPTIAQASGDSVEDALVSEVDCSIAARAFSKLRERHQRILKMREQLGWSYQQIAEYEGIGIEAVQTLLWRARQALRRQFSEMSADDDALEGARLKQSSGVFGGIFFALGALKHALSRFPAKLAAYTKSASGVATLAIASGAIVATGITVGSMLAQPSARHAGSGIPSAMSPRRMVSGQGSDTAGHDRTPGYGGSRGNGSAGSGGSPTAVGDSRAGTLSGSSGWVSGLLPSLGGLNSLSGAKTKSGTGELNGVIQPLSGTLGAAGSAVKNTGGIVKKAVSGTGSTLDKVLSGIGSALAGGSGTGSSTTGSSSGTGSQATSGTSSVPSTGLGTVGSVAKSTAGAAGGALGDAVSGLGGALQNLGG